ncbi:hypothetical protein QFZ63_003173 [Streptomyces sp. B3I7]|nr:hypothetical protein [Streptomyces sp. B3I7]MDQ0811459.1 hypothetical protein [Streptomyces sp. B3I7]
MVEFSTSTRIHRATCRPGRAVTIAFTMATGTEYDLVRFNRERA